MSCRAGVEIAVIVGARLHSDALGEIDLIHVGVLHTVDTRPKTQTGVRK